MSDVETDELVGRLRRMRAAMGATEDPDIASSVFAWESAESRGIVVDPQAGFTTEELENLAHALVQNVATLPAHMRRWAKRSGQDEAIVSDVEGRSKALAIMKELHNRDKHGPARQPGRSGHRPELRNVTRSLQITTRPAAGSTATFLIGGRGPEVHGGDARYVIDGDVVDQAGERLGNLRTLAGEAIRDLEDVAQRLGLDTSAR